MTSDEMFDAVVKFYNEVDVVIMSAAVADYAPAQRFEKKLKKEDLPEGMLELKLKKTKDILKYLGDNKRNQILVGFALETDNAFENAIQKLKQKNLDFIVLNTLGEGSGFGCDTNIVTIISKDGKVESLPKMTKYEVAHKILDKVSQMFNKGEAKG